MVKSAKTEVFRPIAAVAGKSLDYVAEVSRYAASEELITSFSHAKTVGSSAAVLQTSLACPTEADIRFTASTSA